MNDIPAPLIQLLDKTGLVHDKTLPSIVSATQKEWLRAADKERWQIENHLNQFDNPEIKELLSNLHLVDEIAPSKDHYNYALILGGLVQTMARRLNNLLEFLDHGIKIDSFVFLVGNRPLDRSIETLQIIEESLKEIPCYASGTTSNYEFPQTESDGLRLILSVLPLPDHIKEKIVIIDTPMQLTSDGHSRRPTTADTIVQWMHTHPTAGTCLAFSDQPFCTYQHAVLSTLVPKEFTVETVGKAAKPETIAVYFDTIARWLYQESKRLQQ